MQSRSKLVRNLAAVVSSNYAARILSSITGLVIAKILTPFQYGVLAKVDLILSYCAYADAGVAYGLGRQVPFYRSRGEVDLLEQMRDTAFTTRLLTAGAVAVGLLVFAVTQAGSIAPEIVAGLVFGAVAYFFRQISALYKAMLVADERFDLTSRTAVLGAAMGLITIPLIYFFKVYGSFVATALIAVLIAISFALLSGYRFSLRPARHAMTLIVRVGFPILLIDLAWTLFKSIDQLTVARLMATEFLGYYSFATKLSGVLYIAASNVGSVMSPLYARRFAQVNSVDQLRGSFLKPLYATAYAFPVLIGGGLFFGPPLVRLIYPQYVPALGAMQILLLGTFFWALSPQTILFFNAVSRKRITAVGLVLTLMFAGALYALAIRYELGLEGIAVTRLIALGVLMTYLLYAANRTLGKPLGRSALSTLVLFAPFGYLLLGYAGLELWSRTWTWLPEDYGLLSAAINFAIYASVYLGLVAVLNHYTSLFADLLDILRMVSARALSRG